MSHELSWHCQCPGPLCPFYVASPWCWAELLLVLVEPPGMITPVMFSGIPQHIPSLKAVPIGWTRSCPEIVPKI